MKPEVKKLILSNLPYLIFVYLFGKLGQAYRLAAGVDLSEKLLHFMDGCSAAFANAAPSIHPFDLLIGVAGAAALRLMVYCKSKNAKKYRKGEEYGSARWGTAKDIAPYIDPNVLPQPELLDAAEIYNAGNSDEDNSRGYDFAKRNHLYGTSGGDTHEQHESNIGKAGMAFPYRIKTEKELANALFRHDGRCIINGVIQPAEPPKPCLLYTSPSPRD